MLQAIQLKERPDEPSESQSSPQPDPFLTELIHSIVEGPQGRGENEKEGSRQKAREEATEKKEPLRLPSPRPPRVQFNMD